MHRILITGNSGSGKSTMAAQVAAEYGLPHLDLDTLAWESPAVRRPLDDSVAAIRAFLDRNPQWVIEGCYTGLLEAVLPHATELRFLNPGVEACVRNCRSRPWEPHKYPSVEAQNQNLEMLIRWVREYETRDDEFRFGVTGNCSQNSMAKKLSTHTKFKCLRRPCTRRAKTHAGDGER